jgi:hypothetical protein
MKGAGFLGVAGGNWDREIGTTSTAPLAATNRSTFSTFSRQHRPKDHSILQCDIHHIEIKYDKDTRSQNQLSTAQARNSTKASAPSFKDPQFSSTPFFWEWVAPSTTITRWSLFRNWFSKSYKLASKLHVHSVNYAAKLVHTRRALSSTNINSHQETVSGQACIWD